MSARRKVFALEFLLAIFIFKITSANVNLEKSNKYSYGEPEPEPEVEDEQKIIKCQIGNACEAFCVEQNKSSGVEPDVLNDTRCALLGYHLYFIVSKMTTLRPGWFNNSGIIKKVTIRDVGSIVEIEPNAFNDCTFRLVQSLEIRSTAIRTLKKGALSGLNNLKTLSLYANNEMNGIEENALEGLFQLEEFIMEDQKLLTDLGNITGKAEWKYLQSLQLSKNCFGSTIKRPTFRGCTRLQKLNLSNSEIEAIGPESFRPMEETLVVLDLSNNRLKHLPSGLLENLIRPNVQLYLSNNLWDCGCTALELQGYDTHNCSLIMDSPLICETPSNERGEAMTNVSISKCYSSTTAVYDSSTPMWTEPGNLDVLSCFDQAGIAVEIAHHFFNIKQEAVGKVSIEINYPDPSWAMVIINDHDYQAKCQYNLRPRMIFDSLYKNAGYLFCLIKKSSYTTSPTNCLPFHFTETNFSWSRDKIVITLACSLALATVLGAVIAWVLICRYRRAVKKSVLRYQPRNSKSKMINDEFNSWSDNQQRKFFMDAGINLRRSYSENSLASFKTYMTPSPIFDMVQRRNRNSIGNFNEYSLREYIDKLPYDILPPPLPPQNVDRRERIYETIVDPPFCTSETAPPYVYLQRKY